MNMSHTATIPETFPTTLPSLWEEISRIASDCCSWGDIYANEQRNFLEKASGTRFRNRFYQQFSIDKKSGGKRSITAPISYLKGAQKAISLLLTIIYKAPDCVNGFTEGRSVLTNADVHIGKNYVFNTDLKDFFPSITATAVRKALTANGVDSEVAHYISKICTVTANDSDLPEEVLAQGSPASPILSNIVCEKMDRNLEYLARKYGLAYSRYADDISFSSMHNVYSPKGTFLKELRETISRYGFAINEDKTRLQKKGARQEVTGIIVSEKPNLCRKYIKNLRAQIFQMEMFGFSGRQYRSVLGKVNYLGMVRGKDDGMYMKLYSRMCSLRTMPRGMIAQSH